MINIISQDTRAVAFLLKFQVSVSVRQKRQKELGSNWRIRVSIPVPSACKAYQSIPFELIPQSYKIAQSGLFFGFN